MLGGGGGGGGVKMEPERKRRRSCWLLLGNGRFQVSHMFVFYSAQGHYLVPPEVCIQIPLRNEAFPWKIYTPTIPGISYQVFLAVLSFKGAKECRSHPPNAHFIYISIGTMLNFDLCDQTIEA